MKADLPNLRVSPLMKIDGGVSQNDFVNQFIANMTGREIIRHPHPDQMTALGAAFLAGLGAGANHTSTSDLFTSSTLNSVSLPHWQAFGSRRRS